MDRVFGFDTHCSGGVHCIRGTETLVYTSGHTVVLHNITDNTQKLLRGHRHRVTCTALSRDGRWLVTADRGSDAMLIVWDTQSGAAVRTYFSNQMQSGCAALDISVDAMYIVSLNAAQQQTLCIWDWTNAESSGPLCSVAIPSVATMTFVRMHPDNPRQVLASNSSEVVFVDWELTGGSATCHSPSLAVLNLPSLMFTQSCFLPGEPLAVSACGTHVVVWEDSSIKTADGRIVKDGKKAVSVTRSPIESLNVLEHGLIVLGCRDGSVMFVDHALKAIAWTPALNCGPVLSVSVMDSVVINGDTFRGLNGASPWPKGGTTLAVPDFIVATTQGCVLRVCMRDREARTTTLFQTPVSSSTSIDEALVIAAHPTQAHFVMAGRGGLLQLVDLDGCLPLFSTTLPGTPTLISFSPDGHIIAVGLASGALHLLDSLSLQPYASEASFPVLDGQVTHIEWSASGEWFAASADRTLALFRKQDNFDAPYLYVGRIRAHYKSIVSILFGQDIDTAAPRLLSLGTDCMLVEYDLAASSFAAGVKVKGSSVRVEQAATPTSMVWHPSIEAENFLLVATDAAKLKLFNASTKMCRRTVRGPVYSGALDRLLVLPQLPSQTSRFVVFTSGENIGLALLPLDGNPHRYTACVGHPSPVNSIAVTYDGTRLISSGCDGSVHVWNILFDNAIAASSLGGTGLVPFISMLDGGAGGELLRDMEDYFYYSQVRRQGVSSKHSYKVANTVPLAAIPELMRAVGYFPSEEEIQNMTNEIKFSKYVDTGSYVNDIDLDAYIRLFVNHRPVFGLSQQMLDGAFAALGGTVPTATLLEQLQRKGEHMTEEELHKCLALLVGDAPSTKLKDTMTGSSFSSDVLGF